MKSTFANGLVVPVQSAPLNDAVVNGLKQYTQSWSSVPAAVKYEYQSFNDASATSPRWTEITNSTQKSTSNVMESVYWWRIRAIDSNGNKSQWSPLWKLTIDNTSPVANLSVTGNGAQEGGYRGGVVLKGLVNSSEKNVASHKLDVTKPDGSSYIVGPISSSDNNFTYSFNETDNGTYSIKYAVADKAGNVSVPVSKSFTIDTIGPENPPTLLGDVNRYIKPGQVVRSWSKSTSESDVYQYAYKSFKSYDDALNNTETTDYNLYFIQLADGKNSYNLVSETGIHERTFYYRVAAIDKAGNKTWSSEIHSVTVDGTPPPTPTLQITNQTNNALTNVAATSATWNKPSEDTLKYNFRYYTNIPGSPNTQDTPATTELTTEEWSGVLSEGTGQYTFQVQAVDRAGNVSGWSEPFVINLDVTAPAAPYVMGMSGALTNNPSVAAFWNQPSDDTVSYKYRYYSVGTNAVWTESAPFMGETTERSWSGTLEGGDDTYYIQAQAIDQAGNASEWSYPYVVTLDTIAPVITIAPIPVVQTPNTVYVSISVDDPAIELVRVTYNGMDVGPVMLNNRAVSYDIYSPAAGTHTIKVDAVDAAGNPASITRTFVVSPIPEVIEEPVDPVTPVAPTEGNTGNQPNNPAQPAQPAQGDTTQPPAIAQGFVNEQTGEVVVADDEIVPEQIQRPASNVDGGETTDAQEVRGTTDANGSPWGLGAPWWAWLLVLGAVAGGWWAVAGIRRRKARGKSLS